MSKWNENDPDYKTQLQESVKKILADPARSRAIPNTRMLESWHGLIYSPVAPFSCTAGRIRRVGNLQCPRLGEPIAIMSGSRILHHTTASAYVPNRMSVFDKEIRSRAGVLDATWNSLTDEEQLDSLSALAAWAHGELIRIHPFVDSNGRVSRLLVNYLLLRYGTLPILNIRPRPGRDYEKAADASMRDDDAPMTTFIRDEIVRSILSPHS